MSIFLKCPICGKQNSTRNKKCDCGQSLDAAKKNGTAVYYIEYRLPNKKKRREKVGSSYMDAVAADGKRKGQKAEGKILNIAPGIKTNFNKLSEWFIETPRFQKLKSKHVLTFNLNSFLAEFGNHNIYSITRFDLENYQIKRQNAGKSESYIDQEIGAARNMLNTAWSADKVSGDALKPFKQVKKLLKKHANARDIIIEYDDYLRILGALPIYARNIVETAFYTGMRRGEIMGLTWDRVDITNRIITLEREHTKTDEKRIVPICSRLHDILKDIPRHMIVDDESGATSFEPHVFLYKGLPLKTIRAILKKACASVGLPYGRNVKGGITFHDLRHTFNTNMRKSGINETVIMAVTGHKTREMFDRYNTVKKDEQIDAVAIMEKYLSVKTQAQAKLNGNI